MISVKKIRKRNVIFLAILIFSICEAVLLPIMIDGQENSGDLEYTIDLINDLRVRRPFMFKKGVFAELSDLHSFSFKMKQDVEYIARMKVTAVEGGFYFITIKGATTQAFTQETIGNPVTNYPLEVKFTGDATTTGKVEVVYSAVWSTQEPSYTLYLNKSGFAGWWWMVLSGIGSLAVLIVVSTFMIIGMISVSKRKKKGKRRRRK